MFLESLIAVFMLGALIGMVFTWALAVLPVSRELDKRDRREIREARQHLYRAQAREHLGTPYIRASLPLDSIDAFDLDDNDRWSRKAGLRSVQ
jgi:hypothetical protein